MQSLIKFSFTPSLLLIDTDDRESLPSLPPIHRTELSDISLPINVHDIPINEYDDKKKAKGKQFEERELKIIFATFTQFFINR